jgi:hypothetical protein
MSAVGEGPLVRSDKTSELIYTATRLLPPVVGFALWVFLGDGTVTDPVNLLLAFSAVAAVCGMVSVRRYWHIRNTSRSRKGSSLIT